MEKSYTIKELENVLQTEDVLKVEYYFNQFSYLKTQRRDSIKAIELYKQNKLDLNKIVELSKRHEHESLHFFILSNKLK